MLPPASLSRVDEVLIFDPLGPAQLRVTVDLELSRLRERLDDRRITLALTDAARDAIIQQSDAALFGARLIRRVLQRGVPDPLALGLLKGAFHDGDHIAVDARDGALALERGAPASPTPADG